MSSPVAKLIVFIIGGLATLVTQAITWGAVPASARPWANLAIGMLTLVGTGISLYLVPNADPKPKA